MTFCYFLKNKGETIKAFKEFKIWITNSKDKNIKILRTDNGREFLNKEMEMFFKANGIRHQTTIPYTPEQNSVVERANRTVIEKTRCMLAYSNLNKKFGKTRSEPWSTLKIGLQPV